MYIFMLLQSFTQIVLGGPSVSVTILALEFIAILKLIAPCPSTTRKNKQFAQPGYTIQFMCKHIGPYYTA